MREDIPVSKRVRAFMVNDKEYMAGLNIAGKKMDSPTHYDSDMGPGFWSKCQLSSLNLDITL
jgi:hypothetical protein